MTDATANSLLAALQRLADGHVELKLKLDAAEQMLFRQNHTLYDQYVREMDELKHTARPSLSEEMVAELRAKLIEG